MYAWSCLPNNEIRQLTDASVRGVLRATADPPRMFSSTDRGHLPSEGGLVSHNPNNPDESARSRRTIGIVSGLQTPIAGVDRVLGLGRPVTLGLLLAATAVARAPVPKCEEHQDLGYFLDERGARTPIRATADWQKRQAHIHAPLQAVMGDVPTESRRVPLAIEILEETVVAKDPESGHDFPEDARDVAYRFFDEHLGQPRRWRAAAGRPGASTNLRRTASEPRSRGSPCPGCRTG